MLVQRDVIVYYSDWVHTPKPNTSIVLGDMQGFMEVFRDLKGPKLDLFLHSPGGSAEAAARILGYLRTKYSHIRVVVPLAAMSAATMLSLAGDEIIMGKHSQLGPIDPQLVTPSGYAPARAVIEQFNQAKKEISADPSVVGAWAPILQRYGPALIKQCEDQEKLSRRLVREWLKEYMFAGDGQATKKAGAVARWFGDYSRHKSHSLAIDRDQAIARGLRIIALEDDQALQDAALSVHHACMISMQGSPVKIVENHLGRGWIMHG